MHEVAATAGWQVDTAQEHNITIFSCLFGNRALLQWAESPGGKAQIAVELKALRSQASARLVRDMLATSEGKEGLIRGLQAVLASDNTLGTQLRALVGGGR